MRMPPISPGDGGTGRIPFQSPYPEARVLGVRIHAVTAEQVIHLISECPSHGQQVVAGYANIHTINLAQNNPVLRTFLNQTTVTFCDGYGLLLGARLAGYRLPARFTPPDWFPRLAAVFAARSLSMFFLGGAPGVAEKAAARLNAGLPRPAQIHTHHGMFDPARWGMQNQEVLGAIRAAHPDLLVVGMGQPRQEEWLAENWPDLRVPAAITVGAMFDYLAGNTTRAPRWMTDHGLEWAGRLIVEPHRLWRRYLLGIPRFYTRLLTSLITKRQT